MTQLALTWPEVLAWRMRRSHLANPSTAGIEAVAERLVGVQAQVMSSAEVALCIRTKGLQPNDVRTALWDGRSLVKTWTARGTLHLVTPQDLSLFTGAMTLRGEYWAKPSWEKYHGINAKEMSAILGALDEALGDDCLTREELAVSLGKVTRKPKLAKMVMGTWGATIKPAAFRGKLIFGPNKGRNVTFASPSVWLENWRPAEGDEALAALVHRYLDTYGPSTRDDFTRWLGVEPKIGRRAFALVEEQLVSVEVDGATAWLTSFGEKDILKNRKTGSLSALPAFDPYVVGVLKHLEKLVPEAELRAEVSRKAGWISATIVEDGRIIGTWSHKRAKGGVSIDYETWGPPSSGIARAIAAVSKLMSAVPLEDVTTDSAGELS